MNKVFQVPLAHKVDKCPVLTWVDTAFSVPAARSAGRSDKLDLKLGREDG